MELNKDSLISDFSREEMSGQSDAYAYLLTDLPQAKNFVGLGSKSQAIITLSEQKQLGKQESASLIKNVADARKNQDQLIQKDMEESRLAAVFDNKNRMR